ncbi:fibronectin type III domain-containing protein [Thraustotheca clavata]|uniref:Fibronectin type III domain-containing protein n=1 Tax=Thraustotheca clavata TaxID=74557 RepID=A0A1V9YWB9_9STRA|nr:fibronectin type III domain-containing protein [Thraustotheca clavata]
MVFAANSSTTPLQPFTKFHHLPAGGIWTLHIHDRFKDGNSGTLLSWNTTWIMKPCVPTFQWTNITSNIKGTPPGARYQHTAIVFGQSKFVFSGKNMAEFNDLYRLDYNPSNSSGTWVTLSPMPLQRYFRRYGQLMYLSPNQALIFSTGLLQQTFNESDQLKLSQYLVMEPNEPLLPIEISGIAPSQRYFTAASIISATPSESRLVFFGGQDHSSFLGDTWEITLRNPPSLPHSQNAACDWRLQNPQLQIDWINSCGATQSSQPCISRHIVSYDG